MTRSFQTQYVMGKDRNYVFDNIAAYERSPVVKISAMPQRPRQALVLNFGQVRDCAFDTSTPGKVQLRPHGFKTAFVDSFRAWTIEVSYSSRKPQYQVCLRDPEDGSVVLSTGFKANPSAAVTEARNLMDSLFANTPQYKPIGNLAAAGDNGKRKPLPNGEELLALKYDSIQHALFDRFGSVFPTCAAHRQWLAQFASAASVPAPSAAAAAAAAPPPPPPVLTRDEDIDVEFECFDLLLTDSAPLARAGALDDDDDDDDDDTFTADAHDSFIADDVLEHDGDGIDFRLFGLAHANDLREPPAQPPQAPSRLNQLKRASTSENESTKRPLVKADSAQALDTADSGRALFQRGFDDAPATPPPRGTTDMLNVEDEILRLDLQDSGRTLATLDEVPAFEDAPAEPLGFFDRPPAVSRADSAMSIGLSIFNFAYDPAPR